MSDDQAAPGTGQPVPPAPGGWGAVDPRGPGYGATPGYGEPQHGQPSSGQPGHGEPQHGQPPVQPGTGPSLQKPPPQHGAPQYGQPQYGQPQYGAPQYGQPQYGSPQYGAPGYGAPGYGPSRAVRSDKGVIPLRPLSLGEIYDGAIRAVRAQPRVMFGLSAVVVTIAVLLGTLVQFIAMPAIADAVGGFSDELDPTGELDATGTLGSLDVLLGQYLVLPWVSLATGLLTGLLTVAVSRAVIGVRTTPSQLWRESWRDVLLVLLWIVVLNVGIVAAWAAWALGVGALLAVDGSGAAAALLGILGGIGLVVASVWVWVRTTFVAPVMVLEKTGWRSVARSWRLTRGSFWRVLGITLLTTIIASLLAQVLAVPFGFAAGLLMLSPSTELLAAGLNNVGLGLAAIVTTVFTAAVVALLYIDIRIRREGLDVELARATEAAAAAEA